MLPEEASGPVKTDKGSKCGQNAGGKWEAGHIRKTWLLPFISFLIIVAYWSVGVYFVIWPALGSETAGQICVSV